MTHQSPFFAATGAQYRNWTADLTLKTCPVTAGLPTRMLRQTFDRLCLTRRTECKNPYCTKTCKGNSLPPELGFISLPTRTYP